MRRLLTITAVVSSLLLCAAASASAETLSPWWHLTSVSRPSYVQPGTAKQQVWQVRIGATEGSYRLRIMPNETVEELSVGQTPGQVQALFEAREIEEAIEGKYIPDPGTNIEVTSPCTNVPNPVCTKVNNEYEVYEFKLKGELRYSHPGEMRVEDAELSGGPATAEVKEISEGRPDGMIVVSAVNLGDTGANPCVEVGTGGKYRDAGCKEASGPGAEAFEKEPVVVGAKLPVGLEAVAVEATVEENFGDNGGNAPRIACSLKNLSCKFAGEVVAGHGVLFVAPYEQIQMRIRVNVKRTEEDAVSEATVTGGGAPSASVRQTLTESDAPIPFGPSTYEMRPEEQGGAPDTRAGSHPFQLTTTLGLNTSTPEGKPNGLTKDLHFNLPAGLLGNPTAIPRCPLADFLNVSENSYGECPPDTVIGVVRSIVNINIERDIGGEFRPEVTFFSTLLYNLEPAVGEPARFGFLVEGEPVLLDTAVRTGSDYGVTVNVTDITEIGEFLGSEATFWGTPGDERHNIDRGGGCKAFELKISAGEQPRRLGSEECPGFLYSTPAPLLSLPTSCPTNPSTGRPEPLRTLVEGDSWAEPHNILSLANTEPMPVLDGCNRLPFEPSIKVTPDDSEGSTLTGLDADVHVNQGGVLNANSLAESDVRAITVALPEGVAINPAGGDGLEACSEGLVGYEGGSREAFTEPGVGNPAFSEKLPEPLQPGLNFCANASKIGTVTIHSPLLPNPLEGAVYLASQEANPFGSLVAMYIVAQDPVSGTLVKLPGQVHLTPSGQLVTTFEDTPQLPFEDAELHFFGGERAPLVSPSHCGTYTTHASFTPWTGGEPVPASSSFEVKTGPNGSACPGQALPFGPSLTAGTTNNSAGRFSPFTMTMSRPDGQQSLKSVELKLPDGLSGVLSGVELCPEPQASQGLCGQNSLIGETTVSVGVGGDPFTVTGGKVYITGPYRGAPFGLSIVNPAKAGPFDLANTKNSKPPCDCVLVRAKIEVNPLTAALTVTSDSEGPYKIPTILEGIPLQIQHVNVTIDRPGFTFNPTNCTPTSITGAIDSAEGATSPLSVPFQATNCAALPFGPKFSASIGAKPTKKDGQSLHVKIVEGVAWEANVHLVKVALPKQLPSRLTTLQKACTAKQFEANPSGCPPASFVGHAKAITPLLPVPLEGPAIFVSHGGEAFPSLIFVLQGYGVTVDLIGSTFISKTGVTSSTFKTVPDAPVISFELTLPQGPYSALTSIGNPCTSKLAMPTEIIAQNGAEIHQNTAISVTGCPKAKTAAQLRAQKLAAALKACRKDRNKGKQAKCEKAARKKFGPVKKSKPSKKKKKKKG